MVAIVEAIAPTWLRRKVAINGVSFNAKFVATLPMGASTGGSTSVLFIVSHTMYTENAGGNDTSMFIYVAL